MYLPIEKKRISKGMCPRCGQRPPAKDRYTCQNCLDYGKRMREKYRNDYNIKNKERINAAKSAGLCISCKRNPICAESKSWCKSCFSVRKSCNYRYRTVNKIGSHTEDEWNALLNLVGFTCPCCGSTDKLTRDHIIPLSKGGTDSIDNIQPLCAKCNTSKRDRHETNYLLAGGFQF